MTDFDPKGDKALVKNMKLPGDSRARLIFECNKIRYEQFHPQDDRIGLCYLKEDLLQEIFGPLIEEAFGLKVKITRGWGHFMQKGSTRPVHTHNSEVSFLYYLHIPEPIEQSAQMYFVTKRGEEPAQLKQDDLWLFPGMIEHGISEHKLEEIRWAVAGECSIETV
jgi:hypothetical protein